MTVTELRERLEALLQDARTGDAQPYDVTIKLAEVVGLARAAERRVPCTHVAGPVQGTTTPRGRFTFAYCTKCRAILNLEEVA